MRRYLAAIVALMLYSTVAAQSLTPEDISRMLDEQAATPNPYAALLNDPDPARSMGAMKIMMESGDEALVDMALEFGLLSTDPNVQKTALEHYLLTEPLLLITFDGSVTDDKDYQGIVEGAKNNGFFGGTMDADRTGYAKIKIGKFDSTEEYFLYSEYATCLLTVNRNGIFMTGSQVNARLSITPEGTLSGLTQMSYVDDLVPTTITLLD